MWTSWDRNYRPHARLRGRFRLMNVYNELSEIVCAVLTDSFQYGNDSDRFGLDPFQIRRCIWFASQILCEWMNHPCSQQSLAITHPQTFASSSWKPSKLCQDNLKIFLKFLQVISLVHYYDSKFHLFDQETILCKLIWNVNKRHSSCVSLRHNEIAYRNFQSFMET